MSNVVLRVDDLCVYSAARKRNVVNATSFDVRAGETLCVVGESGSGKSVTALSIMGLLPAGALSVTHGTIMLGDENLVAASDGRLRALRGTQIAMVFQEPMTALNPVERVGRQVDEVLRIHTLLSASERRAKVLAMFREVQLPDVERIYDAYPHEISGGQRQRIVISMALILNPKVLIADEPTTALDVTTQQQILTLMRQLQRDHGTGLLFITHDFGVVAELADRIVVMQNGGVVEGGTRAEVLESPRDPYTRMLLSSVPSLVPPQREEPSGAIVLEVKSLSKRYAVKRFLSGHTIAAAESVALTLRRGEILGIVGESGSGKSTVARCVTRLIEPTEGSIRIAGVEIATLAHGKLRALRDRVQIVFQDPYRSLNPRRSVEDALIEGPLNFGSTRDEALARVSELMQMVGLEPRDMRHFPHQFSGGQRQRICIARALALQPDVLVADEAVSALDVSVQAQVLKLLERIRTLTGIAVLFITHDLRVAAQICDTIAVMQRGCIVEYGPAHRVLSSPNDPYTRALIDAAPARNWNFQKEYSAV